MMHAERIILLYAVLPTEEREALTPAHLEAAFLSLEAERPWLLCVLADASTIGASTLLEQLSPAFLADAWRRFSATVRRAVGANSADKTVWKVLIGLPEAAVLVVGAAEVAAAWRSSSRRVPQRPGIGDFAELRRIPAPLRTHISPQEVGQSWSALADEDLPAALSALEALPSEWRSSIAEQDRRARPRTDGAPRPRR
jgi:hypothetical protein